MPAENSTRHDSWSTFLSRFSRRCRPQTSDFRGIMGRTSWFSVQYLRLGLPPSLLPSVLLPSRLSSYISPPSSCPHSSLYGFIFTGTYTAQADILPAIACWSVLQYSRSWWPKWSHSAACQMSMDLRCLFVHGKTVIPLFTFFASVILSLPERSQVLRHPRLSLFLSLSVSGSEIDAVRQEIKTERRRAWRRSLSACRSWYFLHFKTPELRCCQRDG